MHSCNPHSHQYIKYFHDLCKYCVISGTPNSKSRDPLTDDERNLHCDLLDAYQVKER